MMPVTSINSEPKPVLRRTPVRGFSLVSAIFLLVVLAGLGVAIVNISSVSQASSALDVMGSRAYLAARAGVEWGLFQRLQAQGRNGYCNNAAVPVTTDSFALTGGGTLEAFTVTVQCTYVPYPVTPTAAVSAPMTASSNLATGTATGHGFSVGDQVIVTGGDVSDYRGTFTVEAVTNDTFAYRLMTTPAATGVPVSVVGRNQSLDRRQIRATACNQPLAANPQCPNPSPTSPDYVQRVVQVEF